MFNNTCAYNMLYTPMQEIRVRAYDRYMTVIRPLYTPMQAIRARAYDRYMTVI